MKADHWFLLSLGKRKPSGGVDAHFIKGEKMGMD
jgi:hypothetical protein